MTLRRRTFAYMTLLLLGMIIVLFLALQQIILSSFETVEREQSMRNVWRVHYALEGKRDDMLLGLSDWSSWDETYQFVQTGDLSYVEENIPNDETLDYLQLSFMMFLDDRGNERYWYHRTEYDDMDSLRAILTGAMNPNLHGTLVQLAPESFYLVVDDVPMMIAIRPILQNNGTGPTKGWLIWGNILDETAVARLSSSLRLDIRINAMRGITAADVNGNGRWINMTENAVIGGLTMPALDSEVQIEVSQPREILQQARLSVWNFTLALAVFGSVLTVSALFLLDRLMLARVKNLSDAVKLIGSGKFSPIPVEGSDELSTLTSTINIMLQEMTDSQESLQDMNVLLEERVAHRTVELAAQQAQLRAMVDTMGEGLIYNVDGLMAVVNPALADMVGYSPEELIGKPFKTLTPKTDMTMTQDLPRKPDRYDTHLIRRDGSVLEVAITATPVFMQDGKRRRVIIVRDITQEAAMKRQKDYFFARASHELRTPLSNIMTRLYLLERDPQQGTKHLGVLNKVSRQMLTLLNDLLSVARLENGLALEKRPLDLHEILRDVVEVQQSDAELKHIDLTANLTEPSVMIYGDSTRIVQVFTNLIRNAVLYTPDGGKIEVSTAPTEDLRSVMVRIRDNGIGIEPAHIPRLFDPFFRATEGGVGAGLGLYITREIIDLHGGSIQVESTPGVGTTFSVRLALHKETRPLVVS